MKRKAMAFIHHNDGVVSVRAFKADLIEHGDDAGSVDPREATTVAEAYMNHDGTANYAGDGDFLIDEIDLES